MYIFAYACACVCTSSADRSRTCRGRNFEKNRPRYCFFFLPPSGVLGHFFAVSIRRWAFSTGLTTRENERTIGQRGHVRGLSFSSTSIFFTERNGSPFFLCLSLSLSLCLAKRKEQKSSGISRRAQKFAAASERMILETDMICPSAEEDCAIGRQSCNRFYLFYFGRLRIVHRYTKYLSFTPHSRHEYTHEKSPEQKRYTPDILTFCSASMFRLEESIAFLSAKSDIPCTPTTKIFLSFVSALCCSEDVPNPCAKSEFSHARDFSRPPRRDSTL